MEIAHGMSLDPDEPPEVVQGPKAPIQPLDLDETADVVRLPKGPVHSPSSDSILSICSLAEVPQDGQSSCAKIDLNNPSEHKDWVVVKTVQQSGCTERALVLYNAEDNRPFHEGQAEDTGDFANKKYFTLLARANLSTNRQAEVEQRGAVLQGEPPSAACSAASHPRSGHRSGLPRSPPPMRSCSPSLDVDVDNHFVPDADPLATENTLSGYYKKFFIQGKKLGSGGYGGVWKCVHVLQGLELGTYAVKKVPIGTDRQWLLRVLQEVKALERLHRHANIIEYHHSWIEYDQPADFGPKVPCLFILMDYADLGTLESYIQRSMLSGEQEIWWVVINLLNALYHLHSNCIVHRDVKPLNVLLGSSNLLYPNVMLSDLGESMQIMQRQHRSRSGCTGTLEYCAPELMAEDDSGSFINRHDFTSDMWGMGLMTYFMCYERLPYNDQVGVLDQIKAAGHTQLELPKTPKYSKELTNLTLMLLSPNPENRPLPSRILRSTFVRKMWHDLNDELAARSYDQSSTMEPSDAPSPSGAPELPATPEWRPPRKAGPGQFFPPALSAGHTAPVTPPHVPLIRGPEEDRLQYSHSV